MHRSRRRPGDRGRPDGLGPAVGGDPARQRHAPAGSPGRSARSCGTGSSTRRPSPRRSWRCARRRRRSPSSGTAPDPTPRAPVARWTPPTYAALRGGSAPGTAPASGPSGTPATLEDLVLPSHTRREIERLIGWARDRDEVLALGDVQGKGGKGTGICALFSRQPGHGQDARGARRRRLRSAWTCSRWTCPRSSTSTSARPRRTWSGSSRRPSRSNVVLFFDEADALFGAPVGGQGRAATGTPTRRSPTCCSGWRRSTGITVLATNLRGNLDPAFARRLHFIVHFPDPDAPTRRRLWEHHLAQLPADRPRRPRRRRRSWPQSLEVAGGDIRNIVLARRVRRGGRAASSSACGTCGGRCSGRWRSSGAGSGVPSGRRSRRPERLTAWCRTRRWSAAAPLPRRPRREMRPVAAKRRGERQRAASRRRGVRAAWAGRRRHPVPR